MRSARPRCRRARQAAHRERAKIVLNPWKAKAGKVVSPSHPSGLRGGRARGDGDEGQRVPQEPEDPAIEG